MRRFQFNDRGHAEDFILRHRYLYYAENDPYLSDTEYDFLEKDVLKQFGRSMAVESIGSSNRNDYPEYISLGRRPFWFERGERGKKIAKFLKKQLTN